ncbi:MAG: hypothetical protein ACJAYC_000369 [Halieaceae bacterium]|jgi:hypothetical protein
MSPMSRSGETAVAAVTSVVCDRGGLDDTVAHEIKSMEAARAMAGFKLFLLSNIIVGLHDIQI